MGSQGAREPGTRSQGTRSQGTRSQETGDRNGGADQPNQSLRLGDDIAERLLDLAAGVVRLLPALCQQPGATALAKQLERCGPAGGANYEEARGAESPADFVHKVRIALKEVRETCYWLKLAVRAELMDSSQGLAQLIDEAEQLVAILTASASPARRRAERHPES
jgi:four helix bundle protein